MCADLLNLGEDFRTLQSVGCEELHFDIMDGAFVPNFTLGPDFVKAARRACSIPCAAHLMVSRPEDYVDRFIEAGCSTVTIHVETCPHAQQILTRIRAAGASPGIAINPATPMTRLDYLLDYVDRVLVMSVDPGYAGQSIIKNAFDRVRILKEVIRYRELPAQIDVDGNITVKNAALLLSAGAEILVLGTASIFKGGRVGEALMTFREKVAEESKMV
jgi:ribulose-phosphate 3-epimerase